MQLWSAVEDAGLMLGLMCCVPVTMAALCATASSLSNTGCHDMCVCIYDVSYQAA